MNTEQTSKNIFTYIIVLKEFVSLTMVAMEMGKDTTLVIIATAAKRLKNVIKIMNFYIRATTEKAELTG